MLGNAELPSGRVGEKSCAKCRRKMRRIPLLRSCPEHVMSVPQLQLFERVLINHSM
jgi:hypothetical protein